MKSFFFFILAIAWAYVDAYLLDSADWHYLPSSLLLLLGQVILVIVFILLVSGLLRGRKRGGE